MRLLYFYGKIRGFDISNNSDYYSVNFSREFEFDHDKADFFNQESGMVIDVSLSKNLLPHNFWSREGLVYNCTAFVGKNASGKTTVLQNIIMYLVGTDVAAGDGKLVLVSDDEKIYAYTYVYKNNATVYYYGEKELSIIKKGRRVPLKINKNNRENVERKIGELLNKLRIAYFSYAFSENDLLNNVHKYFEIFSSDKKHLAIIDNFSLSKQVEDFFNDKEGDTPYLQYLLFWNNRYKKEAEFALSPKANDIINKLNPEFKNTLPKRIHIHRSALVHEQIGMSYTDKMENLMNGLFMLVVIQKNGINHIEGNGGYFITIHGLFQLVFYISINCSKKAISTIESECKRVINKYKYRISRNPRKIMEDICKVFITLLIDEINSNRNTNDPFHEYERIRSVDKIIQEFEKNDEKSFNGQTEEIVKTLRAVIKIYKMGVWLLDNKLFKSFRGHYEFYPYIQTMRKTIHPAVKIVSAIQWALEAKVSNLTVTQNLFTGFIDKYDDILRDLWELSKGCRIPGNRNFTSQYLYFKWGLSSGQEYLLDMLSSLYKLSFETSGFNSLQIYLDEADMGYHPEWQREWFYFFPQMTEEIFKGTNVKDIQFILATHSPLLLGDIPSRCAKYVANNDKGGNIIIKETPYDEEGEIETFGQNLYTILRRGFFLNKGAIGEIAIHKSEEIARVFELLRELGTVLKSKKCNTEESLKKLIELDKLNAAYTKILHNDSYVLEKEKSASINISNTLAINDTNIQAKISNGQFDVEYGACLTYTEILISLYSGMIRNQLMKEYREIVNSIENLDKDSLISAIDEKIKWLEKAKEELVRNND